MTAEIFDGLRSSYLIGEHIAVEGLPASVSLVQARTAAGDVVEAAMTNGTATFSTLPAGTHTVEALSVEGDLLAEEFVGVRRTLGDDPVMGFVTSFEREVAPAVLSWLKRLRCTVVQVYDWMENYSEPLASSPLYQDPLGRSIERAALVKLIEGLKEIGAVAQAYAPVCAADSHLADAHPEWRLFRNDGAGESLGDLLQIMDPASSGWREHWLEAYGRAVDQLGFNGFHLDTYGYPRSAVDERGSAVSVREGYEAFIDAVRAARPNDVVSFNQVNGVPKGLTPPAQPGFRYVEVWPPNDLWRHLESLMARSVGRESFLGDTFAVYPPVWEDERDSALRTALLTEAVVTTLGANVLIWGDHDGVLCHPYYVNHETLTSAEVETVLEWHRFGLRSRDLFKGGEDTSWYELSDENAAVNVTWSGTVSPEPIGGTLYVRVRNDDDQVVVSLLDLTGSIDGSWSSSTGVGWCSGAEVAILVDSPGLWIGEVSVLGRDDGRYVALPTELKVHREGVAVTCTVPLDVGWSILRLKRSE
jgi:dextranase